ncbi:MAG: glycogen/starch synthase, partial [Ruminococcus sp.]|nr:glycogen/starch synthase [Ruminococcus sp.]
MNILFASSEAVPYAASGGLADVVGTLPKVISTKGHNCAVVIPLYKDIKPELRKYMNFLTNITVDVSWRKQYCGIYMAEKKGIKSVSYT